MCQQELLLGLVVVALGNAQFLAEYKKQYSTSAFFILFIYYYYFYNYKKQYSTSAFYLFIIIILFYKWIGSILFTHHY